MTIAIYFDQKGKMDYPFNNKDYYESYKAFAQLCKKNLVNLYFVRGAECYIGNMHFQQGYQFLNDKLILVERPFVADIIFLKGYNIQLGTSDRTLNHPELGIACHNKLQTYKLFHTYMAPTFQITKENASKMLEKIPTKTIVLKPVFGSEGKGIRIVKKLDFTLDLLNEDTPYFAQAFLDSSSGIPSLVKGIHDLRLIIFNGKVKFSFIRQPKQGSYLANIAQGGKLFYIPVETIPEAALQLAYSVDKHFQNYIPRLYAVDMMFEKDKPYLLELNDQPGLPYLEENKYDNAASRFHRELLDLLTHFPAK